MSVANGTEHMVQHEGGDSNVAGANGHLQANEKSNHYSGAGYQGASISQTLTPGGHELDDRLLITASSHRKYGNPLPLGAFGFATATLTLSLFNLGVQGIAVPNAVIGFALFYGGLTQYLAGLWEFATGNTFGATVFVSFGCFWWGFSMIFIPFFGEMASYDGQPGIYSAMGAGAAEADSAIGLFLFVWGGITLVYVFAAARSSIAIISLLLALFITFMLLGSHYYTVASNPSMSAHLLTAGGAFGVITAFIAYYIAYATILTKNTSYFTLPLGSLAVKD